MEASNKPENVTGDPVLRRAMKEPAKWEMLCPECRERVNLRELLEANHEKIDCLTLEDIAYLRFFYCPYHPFSQMILKPTRSNIKGLLFLIGEVIWDYLKGRNK